MPSSRLTPAAAACSGRAIRSPTTSSSLTCWEWPRIGWSPPATACFSSTSRRASCCHAWPDSGKSLEGYGRGLLAGDFIYWPTKNEIQVLDQRTALRAEPPIKLVETYHTKGGNLVAGDGYLIVAQADGMVVFCQNSRLIERYQNEIARAPDRAVQLLPARPGGRGDRPRPARSGDVSAGRPRGHAPDETIDGMSLVGSGPRPSLPAALAAGGPGPQSRSAGTMHRPISTRPPRSRGLMPSGCRRSSCVPTSCWTRAGPAKPSTSASGS